MPLYLVTVARTQTSEANVRVLTTTAAAAKEIALKDITEGEFVVRTSSKPKVACVVPHKRLIEGSDEWEKAADEIARGEVTLISCADCGYPVVQGYCCSTCGSNEPDRNE